MLKLLYITYHRITENLGQATVVPYLNALSQAGFSVYLISFEKSANKQHYAKTKENLNAHHIVWHPLAYHEHPWLLGHLFDIASGTFTALKYLKKEKINTVHAKSTVPGFMALFLKLFLPITFIFDADGFWAQERKEVLLWGKQSYLYSLAQFLEKIIYRKIDYLIVLTKKARLIVQETPYLNGRQIPVFVKPICIDLNQWYPQNQTPLRKQLGVDGKIVFLYFGSIGTWYLLNEMLMFFKTVKATYSNSLLLFLTPAENISSVEKKCALLALNSNDVIIKYVPHSQIMNWINAADCGLYFIKPLPSKQGSIPTKLGELLACGKPVVTNQGIGDVDEILLNRKTGVMVNTFNESEYQKAGQAIISLLKEPDIAKRCRETAQKFLNIGQSVTLYKQIYEHLQHTSSSKRLVSQ